MDNKTWLTHTFDNVGRFVLSEDQIERPGWPTSDSAVQVFDLANAGYASVAPTSQEQTLFAAFENDKSEEKKKTSICIFSYK